MIKDKTSNAGLYKGISAKLDKALDFLLSTDLSALEKGTHEVDGDNVFAMVNEYETTVGMDAKFESHRQYIDIQVLAEGSEIIGMADVKDLTLTDDFTEGSDAAFYIGSGTKTTLNAGDFLVIYPHEGHLPGRSEGKTNRVKKIVIKVKKD